MALGKQASNVLQQQQQQQQRPDYMLAGGLVTQLSNNNNIFDDSVTQGWSQFLANETVDEWNGLDITWKSEAKVYAVNKYYYLHYPTQIEFQFMDPIVVQKCIGGSGQHEKSLVKLFVQGTSISERDRQRLKSLESKIAGSFNHYMVTAMHWPEPMYEPIIDPSVNGVYLQGHIGLVPFWKDQGENLIKREVDFPKFGVVNAAFSVRGLKTPKDGIGVRNMKFAIELQEVLLKHDLTDIPDSLDDDDAAAPFRPKLGTCRFSNGTAAANNAGAASARHP